MATKISKFRRVESATVDYRCAPRWPVLVSRATVRPQGAEPVEAVLHDLSLYGCRIVSPLAHKAGQRLWLQFKGSPPIAATVVWSERRYAGCRFDEPMDKSLCRLLTLNAL